MDGYTSGDDGDEYDTDGELSNYFCGIPDGLDNLKKVIMSLALETHTSPLEYEKLPLAELDEKIKIFNEIMEDRKRKSK